jgi:hypothetical protein
MSQFTLEDLKGLTVQSIFFADYGAFADFGDEPIAEKKLYYTRGWCTSFTNGIVMVNGGGSCSSRDQLTVTVLRPIYDNPDEPETSAVKWEIVWEDEFID